MESNGLVSRKNADRKQWFWPSNIILFWHYDHAKSPSISNIRIWNMIGVLWTCKNSTKPGFEAVETRIKHSETGQEQVLFTLRTRGKKNTDLSVLTTPGSIGGRHQSCRVQHPYEIIQNPSGTPQVGRHGGGLRREDDEKSNGLLNSKEWLSRNSQPNLKRFVQVLNHYGAIMVDIPSGSD
jgi:hypothetical protein